MAIREALGLSTEGDPGSNSWDVVEKWLRKHYLDNPDERDRKREMQRRRDLYRSQGLKYVEAMIDELFTDPAVQKLRKAAAKYAGFDNVTRSVVGMLSMVYNAPAQRRVAGQADNERYQRLLRVTRQHQLMQRLNAYVTLGNDVWLGFRVARGLRPLVDEGETVPGVDDEASRTPMVDVVFSSDFYAVAHPDDPRRLLGMIFDLAPRTLEGDASKPAYLMWTDGEVFRLDSAKRILRDSIMPNKFRRMPGVLVHREPPDERLLDPDTFGDVIAGHLAAWLQHAMMVKESKSVNRQVALSGDLSTTASGQSQESEIDVQLGDGVTVQTIDRGVELAQFRETAEHIVKRAAANYNIPAEIIAHAAATSADEILYRRLPLMERRREQITVFRDVERDFAEVQSVILAEDMPSLAFDTEGWEIDFAELEVPLSPKQELEVFEHRKRLGLTDTLEFMMRQNPDLTTREQALKRLEEHIDAELDRNMAMRGLQAINGSASQSIETARTPQQNGADGRAAAEGDEEEDPVIQ